jgi:hypothetical protein
MTTVLAPLPVFRACDNSGNPLVGGQLYTYAAGTTTPIATYVDSTETTQNSNPVILNARGEANVWLDPTLSYKLVLEDANGVLIWSVDQIVGGYLTLANITAALIGSVLYPTTAQETSAGVTPTAFNYPELDIRRYGATAIATGAANATAIQSAISVLAQHTNAELLIPAGVNFPVTQVTFTSLSNFNVRCDGSLTATSAAVAGAFVNQTSSQGVYSPMLFTSCSRFKVYGRGYINNVFVDAGFVSGCTDFDWSLDLRGSCTNAATPTGNSNMNGFTIVGCTRFRFHDMVVDSITSQNMNTSTDVYYSWLNNLFLASGNTDFEMGPNILSRKAGYGAFYVGSSCFDFSIHDNIGEFNSGTACQLSGANVACPQRFVIANNIWRYNQEDAFCVQNTSGAAASVSAAISGNLALFNGFCNCGQGGTPSAGGGAGINCLGVDDVAISGNTCYEHTTAAYAFVGCARVAGDLGTTYQSIAASAIGLEMITGSTDFKLSGGTIFCGGSSAQSALLQNSFNDVSLSNISFYGQFSDSAAHVNSLYHMLTLTCPAAVSIGCSWTDCVLTVTGTGAQGGIVAASNLKIRGCVVTAPSNALVINTLNDVVVENTTATSTSGTGIQIIGSQGIRLIGSTGNSSSGYGIGISGSSDRAVIFACSCSSTSSNALNMASSSVTNATLVSLRVTAGTTSTTGATFLNSSLNAP